MDHDAALCRPIFFLTNQKKPWILMHSWLDQSKDTPQIHSSLLVYTFPRLLYFLFSLGSSKPADHGHPSTLFHGKCNATINQTASVLECDVMNRVWFDFSYFLCVDLPYRTFKSNGMSSHYTICSCLRMHVCSLFQATITLTLSIDFSAFSL